MPHAGIVGSLFVLNVVPSIKSRALLTKIPNAYIKGNQDIKPKYQQWTFLV